MPVIVVGSAKGAPGVSTTTLALGAAWSRPARLLVVEADASGGDAMLRFGMRETPGLVSLAAASRRSVLTAELVREHAQRLPGGVEMVIASPEAGQCTAALDALGPAWADAELDGALIFADCGRLGLEPDSRSELLRIADVVLLVSGGAVEALAHTAEVAERLRTRVRYLALAVVGRCAWPAEEVETALGADVCVMLPYDETSAALLRGTPMPRRRWPSKARYPLLDATRPLAQAIERQLLGCPEPGSQCPDTDLAEQQTSLASVLGGDRG